MKGNFENSLQLTRFLLRRERTISTGWILALAVVIVGLVPGMYNVLDAEGREALVGMMDNPALVSMMGPNYAAVNGTFGALYSTTMLLMSALTVGLMNIFLVVRNTRADEEKVRFEVLRSLPIGRLANLNATMCVTVLVNAVLALVIGLGMFALGDASMDLVGSMLWGAALGVTGLCFAAFAALFCQLSSNSRGAMGYSFAALGFFYLLRAPGDMNADLELLSLFSPLGLMLRVQAYAGNYWWPILILLGITLVVAMLAYRFNAIRDIDQGIIPARPGPADGGGLLRSPSGLSLRLLRTSLIVWIFSMLLLAAAYGTVMGEIDEFIATNEMYQQLMLGPAGVAFAAEAGLTPEQIVALLRTAVAEAGFTMPGLFSATINNIMGIFALVPLLMFVLKAKGEEKDIRTELILATPVSRYKYLAGFACIAFLTPLVLQATLALGMYGVAASILPNPEDLPLSFLLQANLVYVPAQWVMVGGAIFFVGLLPKATGAIWGYFAFSFLVMFFGRMDIFPAWTENLTPFGWVPLLPVDEITLLPLLALTGIAALLTVLGFIGYRKRDINAITH